MAVLLWLQSNLLDYPSVPLKNIGMVQQHVQFGSLVHIWIDAQTNEVNQACLVHITGQFLYKHFWEFGFFQIKATCYEHDGIKLKISHDGKHEWSKVEDIVAEHHLHKVLLKLGLFKYSQRIFGNFNFVFENKWNENHGKSFKVRVEQFDAAVLSNVNLFRIKFT